MNINEKILLAANIYPAKKVDGRARLEAHKEILGIISTIVETYGDYLENRYGHRYSYAELLLLLGSWVNKYAEILYAVLDTANYETNIRDKEIESRINCNDDYYSLVLNLKEDIRQYMLGREEMKFKAQDDGIFVLGKGLTSIKWNRKHYFYDLYLGIRNEGGRIIETEKNLENLGINKLRIDEFRIKYGYDAVGRNLLHRISQNNKKQQNNQLTRIVSLALLSKYIPSECIEGYTLLRYWRDKMKHTPETVISAQGIFTSQLYRNICIKVLENKGNVINMQHGGGIGINNNHLYDYEKKICTKFITWGWKKEEKEYTGFIPMSLPKCDLGKSINVLVVVSIMDPWPNRYHGLYLPGRTLEEYRDLVILTKCLSEQTPVHLKPSQSLIKNAPYLFNRLAMQKNVHIITSIGPTLIGLSDKAKIIILMNLSTPALENAVRDNPFMVYSQVSRTEYDEDFRIVVDTLNEAGILHFGVEGILKQYAQIQNNIDRWWRHKKTMRAIKMLKDSQVSYKPIEKLPESIAEIAGINNRSLVTEKITK